MSEIPEYLKDNPDYYIDGGEELMTNIDKIKNEIDIIINKSNFLELINNINKTGKILIKDKDKNLEVDIGLLTYVIEENEGFWGLTYSQINDSLNRGQGYGKILYILTALEAVKYNKTFTSDYLRNINVKARYLWNFFVNLGLVEYDENIRRFKFINNMLEDYFPNKIKNTD